MKFKEILIESIKKDLRKQVEDFRDDIEKQYGWKNDKTCFRGTCQHITTKLVDYLKDKGYEAKRVGGYYYPPMKWFEKHNEPYEDGEWKHWWVEVSGKWIVDVTADQFHPGEEDLYRVVIKEKNESLDYEIR